ncbi:MAG: hypothetical protein LBL92_05540, partial [Propionibacteriaceae bacterium]|nr:hypothetical protein [Propionibacteriaceae bacterium]
PEHVIDPEPLNYGWVYDALPTLKQAAQATLDACLEEEAFSPSAHCGFGFSRTEDGTTVDDFTWSILSGNLDQLTFTPSATDPLQVTAPITVALHGEGLASNGSRYQGDQTLTLVTADVTDPAAVSISFSRT